MTTYKARLLNLTGASLGLFSFYLASWAERPLAPRSITLVLLLIGLSLMAVGRKRSPSVNERAGASKAGASVLVARYVAVIVTVIAVSAFMSLPYIEALHAHRQLILPQKSGRG